MSNQNIIVSRNKLLFKELRNPVLKRRWFNLAGVILMVSIVIAGSNCCGRSDDYTPGSVRFELYESIRLLVVQTDSDVVVENVSSSPLEIHISWDGEGIDTDGQSDDLEHDKWTSPGDYLSQTYEEHSSVQVRAFNRADELVDSCNVPLVIPRGIIIPAYFYPDVYWNELANAALEIGDKLIVIVNVENGPGEKSNSDYKDAVDQVRSNGGLVIGYVHTCHGNQNSEDDFPSSCTKTEAIIKTDIDRWYEWYSIDGIFFDEVSPQKDKTTYYQSLYDYVQTKQPEATVVMNFGIEPDPAYFEIGSTILCIYENEFPDFIEWTPPDWMTEDQLDRSLVLVHNTSKHNFWTALAISKEVGWYYITSDSDVPWDSLPSYFPNMVDSCQ